MELEAEEGTCSYISK